MESAMSNTAEVSDGTAKLEAITQRRNALLCEIHQMLRRRHNIGSVLTYNSEDESDLPLFIHRFKITADDPERGSISLLGDEECAPLSCSDNGISLFSEVANSSIDSGMDLTEPTTSSGSLPAFEMTGDVNNVKIERADNGSDEEDELDLLRKTSPVRTGLRHIAPSNDVATPGDINLGRPIVIEPIMKSPEDNSDIKTLSPQVGPLITSSEELHSDLPHNADSFDQTSSRDQEFIRTAMAPPRKQILVRKSQPTLLSKLSEQTFIFPELRYEAAAASTSETPYARLHHFKQDFTLPSVKLLNIDHSRKGKSSRRKRDKDRDGSNSNRESRKDDWIPGGLNRWAAILSSNSVWKRVARASKCLSSREWAIAMSELRLLRAIDRIELLKRDGRWSFRQPKKQRLISGIPKTHWDHMLGEMKWMRIDFREERKWKVALAYNLSSAVLDWHAAGSTEARQAKGISVQWRQFRLEKNTVKQASEMISESFDNQMDLDRRQYQPDSSLLDTSYGSDEDEDADADADDEEDCDNNDAAVITHPIDPIDDSFVITEQVNSPRIDDSQEIQLKMEEIEDVATLAIQLTTSNPIDKVTTNALNDTKPFTSGLKTTSSNPVLASQPTASSHGGESEPSPSTVPKLDSKANYYVPFREVIAYMNDDQLFLDLEEFCTSKTDDSINFDGAISAPSDLMSIFPDLQTLTLSDSSPTVQQSINDGKKRSDKRIDRDDPAKRSDDVLYTRLYPTGDFMLSKPTLVGPLRPSRNWKDGYWSTMEESAVLFDSDVAIKVADDAVSDIFDSRPSNTPSAMMTLQLQALLRDKETRKRSDHVWANADDVLLKSLIDKYPNNWALISECFNASRLTISTDRRTPRDCLERWRDKWGSENRRPTEVSSTGDVTLSQNINQVTTRGVKRLVGAGTVNLTENVADGSEPRKRRRHALVQETIRKANKKKAETLQKIQFAQRKPPAIHETHAQYSKLPKRTPAELSRMKAEKEARELAELQARKRQEEINRQAMMNRMMLNGQTTQPAMPQPQQLHQVGNSAQRSVGNGLPPQVVPQIRSQVNISQQQRTNTPSMQPGSRLNQQQQMLAQVRAAQHVQHAQVIAQNQSQIQNGPTSVNGSVATNSNGHLSPPYVARDVTSSPAHVSPPHVPSAVNSPRPSSAQGHPLMQAGQVSGSVGTRVGYYLPNVPVQGYMTEQIQNALRQQQQQQQQGAFPGREGRSE